MSTLITVAHGTREAAGPPVARSLTATAGNVLGVPSVASFVELADPLFSSVVGAYDDPVVVPLLLSRGFHIAVDLPAMASGAPVAPALGPSPWLAVAAAARLDQAGAESSQRVVLVAAGSRDPEAWPDVVEAAQLLAEQRAAPVEPAVLSGVGPPVSEVVQPGDAVSPYLLAPGHFATRARRESLAAGAGIVAEVMGAHRAVMELICARYYAMTHVHPAAH